ncbi:DEAD/DEAH box helicase [Paludibaculum fermentans]|uniref:DEAD/DEAH box helicase n=1 Tax=Paludibaculum fermentans TaxID=1473598 RepID=UPI003EBD4698
MDALPIELGLTPHGRLVLAPTPDGLPVNAALTEHLTRALERGAGHVLLLLGAGEVGTILPPALSYWRDFGARYVTALCTQPEGGQRPAAPTSTELDFLTLAAPPMLGAEYLTAAVLETLWFELDDAFYHELAESQRGVQEFLKLLNPAWNLVGRVHFNVAENRKDPDTPFAFIATYTTRLSANAKAQHLPLGQALREYAGAGNKDRLLSLLLPVQRASETCGWLKSMVEAGEIFHPLRWTPRQTLDLLRDVPQLEAAGVVVRMPAAWGGHRPPRPRVTGTVGAGQPAGLGQDALLDFKMDVTLEGEPLTAEEIQALLAQTDGLALVRGRWIELDRDHLQKMLARFREVENAARETGLGFGEAMRLLAGADVRAGDSTAAGQADWTQVVAGPWLAETLKALRTPQAMLEAAPGQDLRGTLRPYQQAGVSWLYFLSKLGLGACLADDMGLGKTIQVLSLLLVLKRQEGARLQPSLLVAPASLLANWASELERFAPGLNALIAHPSAMPASELKSFDPRQLQGVDLVITSYGSLLRAPWLSQVSWQLAVLDEAQAIKNPGSKQTRAVKQLKASARLALTGTPVENRLVDLWSIFDFVNPGLLGTVKEFSGFVKRLAERPHGSYGPLRELVRPYILRRLKTDKSVIADLPDKTEIKAYCPLSRPQAALYGQAVKELAAQIADTSGIQRKGLVLAFLMRFKQICNHPSQWLGDGSWSEADSGKLARLREIAEVVASRQEKMLVFTQFREVTTPLAAFLESVFQRPGLVLHGETEVRKRKDLVRRFQEDERLGFFVLSLKAGGSGLNLTAASHVVHFDRWWNPAVENQATDRAFRIGQTRNVLVHKFVCRGTVEDKIDQLIESKRHLSDELLEGGAGALLTEMKDDELLRLVALDLDKALQEA